VRSTSLCLMINGHITAIFVEISHERQFSIKMVSTKNPIM
jgi:hypothetical protein